MEIIMTTLEGSMPLSWWNTAALGVLLLGFVVNMVLFIRLSRKMKKFQAASVTLQTFMSGRHLDSILSDSQNKILKQDQELSELDRRLSRAETKLRAGADRVEVVRFKAFEKEGSDLSFALALLNQEGSGLVMSSINNRDESRVYAKPVKDGQSTYPLTNEEREVIDRARQGERV